MTHSGGKPHNVGDRGQRYEVTYFDPRENVRKVFGWSDDAERARAMGDSIDAHPVWNYPQVLDRHITPALIAAAPALLALARQYASECGECDGKGTVAERDQHGGYIDDKPCPDCADIRAVIAKAVLA